LRSPFRSRIAVDPKTGLQRRAGLGSKRNHSNLRPTARRQLRVAKFNAPARTDNNDLFYRGYHPIIIPGGIARFDRSRPYSFLIAFCFTDQLLLAF
jgi:hypothetical protein